MLAEERSDANGSIVFKAKGKKDDTLSSELRRNFRTDLEANVWEKNEKIFYDFFKIPDYAVGSVTDF